MAWVPIESYYLRYNPDMQQCIVGIHYMDANLQGVQKPLSRQLSLPAFDAMFLTDMLRNEKPVFFDTDSGAIVTGKEEVGEGEGE